MPNLRFARIAAWCAVALALMALAWGVAGVTEPMRLPVLYPMRRATATGVGCLAISLLMMLDGRIQWARRVAVLAIFTGILTGISLMIRWSQVELTPQQPLPPFAVHVYSAYPNVLCFLFAGGALALLASWRDSTHRAVLASIAGAVTCTLSIAGMINELLGLLPTNTAFEGEVALDATLALALIGGAMIQTAYARAEAAGGEIEILRPVLVAILGTLGAFGMWRSLLGERSRVVAYQTLNTSSAVVRSLRSELTRRMREVRYAAEEPTPSLFEETGVPKSNEIRWTDSRTVSASQAPQDERLRALLAERLGPHKTFYGVYQERDQPPHVVFGAPLKNGLHRLAIVRLSDMIDATARNVVGPNFQIFLLRNGKDIYRFPNPPRPSEIVGQAERQVEELEGVIRVQPRSQFVRRGASWASHMVLAIGLNASFLLAFSAYLLYVVRARLDEVQTIRNGLEKEIQQRRLAQAELAHKARQLEASNADLREFAHVTSHDLQEPLRSINGFALLLTRRYKGQLDQDADEFLEYITEASMRMSGMIQGLLAYSRLVHAAELDEEFPLSEAVVWAKSNLLLAIEESNAKLKVGRLPVTRGNRLQFCQLMQNLIGNAIKYRGSKDPLIEVTSENRNGEVVVVVADNGIGIGPEFQDRIFGLFKRAHGRDYPGAGVGLALCKKIVERHGGRIWVESELGKGSRFQFTANGRIAGG